MVSDSSRFVIAMGTNDPSGTLFPTTQDPLLIRWSQQEEYQMWTPAATNQAGDYRLSRGSEIVAAQQTRQEILVFTDAAVYSMQYLGPPYVWGFQIMGDNISIAGPNVVSVANNVTYWMGADKFYMYSGRVETLPCVIVAEEVRLVCVRDMEPPRLIVSLQTNTCQRRSDTFVQVERSAGHVTDSFVNNANL